MIPVHAGWCMHESKEPKLNIAQEMLIVHIQQYTGQLSLLVFLA